MNFAPHPYQVNAIEKACEQDTLLAFDCGLGKTAVTLTVIRNLLVDREIRAALIVAPLKTMRLTWPLEIEKWDHARWMQHVTLHGKGKGEKLKDRGQIYLVNYDGLIWLGEVLRRLSPVSWPFNMVVWDEVTKMKDPSTRRWKLWRSLIPQFRRRLGLTGTPAGEGMQSLFGQVYCLDAGARFGKSRFAWERRWFRKTDWHGYKLEPTEAAMREIPEKLSGLVLHAKAEDHLTIPPCNMHDVEVPLPPNLKTTYKQLEKKFFTEIDETPIVALTAATALNKCLQFASGAIYSDALEDGQWQSVHDVKMKALKRLIADIDGPVIVAYMYRHECERVLKAYPKAVHLKSGLPEAQERAIQARWNRREIPVLICHPASAGHGLNLQSGQHLIWFTLNWSFELVYQMQKRIDRQGQTSPTHIYRILMSDTADEIIAAALETKDTSQRALLAAIKQYRSTEQ